MNIGEASARSGLPAKTIRYYEEIGLLAPERSANGYRAFSEDDAHRLAFLARARAFGFSIEECRALLALYGDEDRASGDVRHIAESHLAHIDRQIAELAALRATLAALVGRCHGGTEPDCPILTDLAGEEPDENRGRHGNHGRERGVSRSVHPGGSDG